MMCSPGKPFAPKSRRQRRLTNLFLAIGLPLSSFTHPASQFHRNWLALLSGVLVGIAVAVSVCLFRFARCLRP